MRVEHHDRRDDAVAPPRPSGGTPMTSPTSARSATGSPQRRPGRRCGFPGITAQHFLAVELHSAVTSPSSAARERSAISGGEIASSRLAWT
jgi:hypothetical protein